MRAAEHISTALRLKLIQIAGVCLHQNRDTQISRADTIPPYALFDTKIGQHHQDVVDATTMVVKGDGSYDIILGRYEYRFASCLDT
jgi:hypothetical protein